MFDPEIFDFILKHSHEDATFEDIYCGLIEELGEFSLAYRVENGYKYRQLKDSARTELIDTALLLIELYIILGGSIPEAKETAKLKLKKWITTR